MTTEATTEPAVSPEPQSRGATTTYIVLEHGIAHTTASTSGRDATITEGPVWREVSRVQAGSPQAAMRAYAEKLAAADSSRALQLAAVAARYWSTETLKPKTVTTWETAS